MFRFGQPRAVLTLCTQQMRSLPTFEPVFHSLNNRQFDFSMKNLIFFLVLLLNGVTSLNAQRVETTAPTPTTGSDLEIRKATEALTAKYGLNADQAKQAYITLLRKEKNLAQIATLQTSDPALYRAKAQNVQKGTLASIRRILQSKEQVEIYQKTQAELRVLRNKKQKELVAKKASKAEIETALLAIYAE